MKVLKVLVLLVSISAASALVWYATRDKGSSNSQEEPAFNPDDMQVSSKSGPMMRSDDIAEIVEEPVMSKVTDEEIKAVRDSMLSTSKSGIIMSDDKIREMLEDQKKEELNQKSKPHLMPSSKSIDAILRVKDVEEIIEGDKKEPNADPVSPPVEDPFSPIEKKEK